jgi:hypothetical protein
VELFYRRVGEVYDYSFGVISFPLFIEFSSSCRDAPLFFTTVRPNRRRWSNKGELPHPHIFPVLVLGRTLGAFLQLDWTARLDNRIGQPKSNESSFAFGADMQSC